MPYIVSIFPDIWIRGERKKLMGNAEESQPIVDYREDIRHCTWLIAELSGFLEAARSGKFNARLAHVSGRMSARGRRMEGGRPEDV